MVIDVGNDVLVRIRKISHCRFGYLHRKRRQKLVLLLFSGPCYDQAHVKVAPKKPLFPSGVLAKQRLVMLTMCPGSRNSNVACCRKQNDPTGVLALLVLGSCQLTSCRWTSKKTYGKTSPHDSLIARLHMVLNM